MTGGDREVVQQFRNFLSWGVQPSPPDGPPTPKPWPPAVFAYVLGFTRWCPPQGEM